MTLERFLEMPERKPALEFEDGEVVRRAGRTLRQIVLMQWLQEAVDANRDFVALPGLRVTFGGQSCVPDVSVFRWQQLPRTADGEWADDVFAPPTVAVEVLKRRQPVARLLRRCIWYVRNGVVAGLLVDEKDRSVFVFRAGTNPVAVRGGDVIDVTDVVPGLRFTADELFSALREE
jgi:Uma2 family endonuclease